MEKAVGIGSFSKFGDFELTTIVDMANIGKRKPQQTIDRECASVNYTESASAEAQFHSSLILSSQQSQNCTHLRYAFTGACIVRMHSRSLLN